MWHQMSVDLQSLFYLSLFWALKLPGHMVTEEVAQPDCLIRAVGNPSI